MDEDPLSSLNMAWLQQILKSLLQHKENHDTALPLALANEPTPITPLAHDDFTMYGHNSIIVYSHEVKKNGVTLLVVTPEVGGDDEQNGCSTKNIARNEFKGEQLFIL